MSFTNSMRRTLAKADPLPEALRRRAVAFAIRRTIPFVGTAGVDILEISPGRVELVLVNRRPVQNHIGGVHAAATALLAETASGLVLGMNIKDSAVPVLREMRIEYVRRAHGSLRAVGTLDAAAQAAVQGTDSGDLDVPVTVTDEAGEHPVECVMRWAWRPKR
jgi:acyl-coenzyme A thioesterase PaaI-like protein